jgi:hypothetical protein
MPSSAFVISMLASLAAGCGSVASMSDAGPARTVSCDPTSHTVGVLANGSFDAPTPPWIQDPVSSGLLCGAPRITPFDGATAGCLGGVDGMTATLSQTIPLPAGAIALTLNGQICIATAETAALDKDLLTFNVLDGDVAIAPLGLRSNQQGKVNCQFAPFTLQVPLSSDPTTAILRIRSTLDANMPTSFYLEALTLSAACKP